MSIEHLARVLAEQELFDYLTGDRWDGWPANAEQEDEYLASAMPACREVAQRYAELLARPDHEDPCPRQTSQTFRCRHACI